MSAQGFAIPDAASVWRQVPNVLTVFRIALVPLLVLAIAEDPDGSALAVAIFVLAAMTDVADGRIARRQEVVSTFGKLADPIADKLLIGGALVALAVSDQVATWIVVVVLGRELAVTLLRWHAKREGIIVPASIWGKAKMVLQCAALVALLAVPGAAWVNALLYVTVAATVVSGIDYALHLRQRADPAPIRVAHPPRVGVDVHRPAPREAAQRDALLGGERDGQRAGRAHGDEDRRARDGGLLHELEREAPAHAQHVPCNGSRPSSSARPTTLSIALWRPTSSRTTSELAARREQAGGVQAARALERRLAQPVGEAGEERAVIARPGAAGTGVHGDLLERALAADAARRARVEAARAGIARERAGDVDGVGGEVRGRVDAARAHR